MKIRLAAALLAASFAMLSFGVAHAQEVPRCPNDDQSQGCYSLGGGDTVTVTRTTQTEQYPPTGIEVVIAQPHFTG